MLMLTLCGTGIRIGELEYITVEAVRRGRAEIRMKGKNMMVILQKELRKKLLKYVKEQGIEGGYIFRTRSGKPMDRSNICHDMNKKPCSTLSLRFIPFPCVKVNGAITLSFTLTNTFRKIIDKSFIFYARIW